MNTDFHELLFHISEALVTKELVALKFLCVDHVPMGKLEAIQEPKDFFEVLQERDMIKAGNLAFLKELFYYIGRIDLLDNYLDSSRKQMERELQVQGRAKVSAYRQLLYRIAEDLPPEDVGKVKFLLRTKLSKTKLQDDASIFQVLLEMERNRIIKEDDLSELKNILTSFRTDIKEKIDIYEEKNKEELHYPVPVHPGEQGAEGNIAHLPGETYTMKNIPHGYCVILNNYKFNKPRRDREGTVEDGEAVKRVFEWLQFETVEHMNLEAKEIYEKVKEYSQIDHSNMDCFVCFIFSHGEKHKIKGVDEECINIKDLVSCFSGSNCPSLAGKPKVFFIQACQGSVAQPAVLVEADFSENLETDATPLTSIPDLADILVGMATVEDCLSFRIRGYGSVYIQCVCEKIKLLCPQVVDLLTILTAVNKEVGRKEFVLWNEMTGGKELEKQMPQIISTLRKQLIFKIPQGQSSKE